LQAAGDDSVIVDHHTGRDFGTESTADSVDHFFESAVRDVGVDSGQAGGSGGPGPSVNHPAAIQTIMPVSGRPSTAWNGDSVVNVLLG
jgi:hypothetical protein